MTQRIDIGAMFGAGATDTFLGLPSAGNLAAIEAAIAILGVPCATPYRSVGPYCAGAPKAIRAAIAGYAPNLRHVDFDLGGPIFPAADHGGRCRRPRLDRGRRGGEPQRDPPGGCHGARTGRGPDRHRRR